MASFFVPAPARRPARSLPRAPAPDLTTPGEEWRMAMQVRTRGCMFSIIASIVLTILLNVMLRACSSGY
jgi:hypothetical protein